MLEVIQQLMPFISRKALSTRRCIETSRTPPLPSQGPSESTEHQKVH